MLNKIWPFLKAEENQNLLGWIGGGLVVLATGLWAVFVHFYPSPEAKPPLVQKQIEAECGSVAIGGGVSGATITAGSSGDCPKPNPPGQDARVNDRPTVYAEEGSIANRRQCVEQRDHNWRTPENTRGTCPVKGKGPQRSL